jgi:hypothetical protein
MISRSTAALVLAIALVVCAPAQTVNIDKAQLDKNVWIANAKFNIDTSGQYQLVAAAAGLHAAFSSDPTLSTDQGLSIIRDTLRRFDSWHESQGSAANPAEIYQKTLSLMADVATSKSIKAAAAIGKDLLAFLPESTPIDDWKRINAFQSTEFNIDRARETTVLESVYNDAQSSTPFRSALDRGLGPRLKGLTTEDAATLLDHNPELSKALEMQTLSKSLHSQSTSIKLSMSDIKNNLNLHLGELKDIVHDDTLLLGRMNKEQADIRSYLADAAAQQRAAELARQQQQLDELRLEAADAAFQVFGTMIGGKTGSQIAQTGQVAVKVAGSISNFVNNTSKLSAGLGAAVLTGNLLSAAIELGGLFGGGQSDMDMISGQLAQLSRQIADMQKDMDTRFDRIDSELAQIYDRVNRNFQQEMRMLQVMDVKLDLIREDLLGLSQQLNGVENVLLAALRNLENQTFYSQYGEYYRYYEQKHLPMAEPQFDEAEKVYLGAMSLGSVPPQVDSNVNAAFGDGIITRAVRGSANTRIYTALPPDEINFVLATAGAPPAGGPLVNPQLWLIATSAYLDLANQPKSVSGSGKAKATFICQASKAGEFRAAGERLKSAMINVVASDFTSGATGSPLFSAQLKGYSDNLDKLIGELNTRRADVTKTLTYDPWLPFDQPTSATSNAFSFRVIECGVNKPDYDDRPFNDTVPLRDVGAIKGLFGNASHFTQYDRGLSLCLTDLRYSTNSIREMSGILPLYVRTLAVSGTAHLRYRGVDFAQYTFTSDPFDHGLVEGLPADIPNIRNDTVSWWPKVARKMQTAQFVPTDDASRETAINLATADLGGLFVAERKKLIAEAWYIPIANPGPVSNSLQVSLTTLTDYKSMLWALAQIGLPTSFDSDEVFRSYLATSNRTLLDTTVALEKFGYLVSKATDDEVRQFDIVAYEDQAKSGVHDFESSLAAKLAGALKNGGDPPSSLVGGLEGLDRVEKAYTACHPD